MGGEIYDRDSAMKKYMGMTGAAQVRTLKLHCHQLWVSVLQMHCLGSARASVRIPALHGAVLHLKLHGYKLREASQMCFRAEVAGCTHCSCGVSATAVTSRHVHCGTPSCRCSV